MLHFISPTNQFVALKYMLHLQFMFSPSSYATFLNIQRNTFCLFVPKSMLRIFRSNCIHA